MLVLLVHQMMVLQKTVLAVCVVKAPVRTPDVVTGEPLTENTETGNAKPTLVTVPELGVDQLIVPAVVELKT